MNNHYSKRTFHACFTSHHEVMFRKKQDVDDFINCMALASFKMDSPVLADAEMSTHVHLATMCHDPGPLINSLRARYTKYFNREYKRSGPLGERYFYELMLEGRNHKITALSYILRNGLHHGQSSSAFGYEFCSARDVFANELGYPQERVTFTSHREIAANLPRFSDFPDYYVMNSSGVFVRRSFEELEQVEGLFGSSRSYSYYLSRKSSEEWALEQEKDNNSITPITINDIEVQAQNSDEIAQMLKYEKGQDYQPNKATDMMLCEFIDRKLASRARPITIYQASDSDKARYAKVLRKEFHASERQIARVLVL